MKFKLLYLGGVEAGVVEYVQYVDRSLAEVFNTPVVLGMYMLSGRAEARSLIRVVSGRRNRNLSVLVGREKEEAQDKIVHFQE